MRRHWTADGVRRRCAGGTAHRLRAQDALGLPFLGVGAVEEARSAPVTLEERTATAKFLSWVAELVDVSGENEGRAKLAQNGC